MMRSVNGVHLVGRALCWLVLILVVHDVSAADSVNPFSRLYDGADGATCEFFNAGARLRWVHKLGDWIDSSGIQRGQKPFAEVLVEDRDNTRLIEIDVTALVQGWTSERFRNEGLLLRGMPGRTSDVTVFHSREAANASFRPKLLVLLDGGGSAQLPPSADTTLNCSTVASLGARASFRVGRGDHAAMQFDVELLRGRSIAKAVLQLTTFAQFGNNTLGIYRLQPPVPGQHTAAHTGLSARYPADRDIARDPDVLMATGFESPLWRLDWSWGFVRGTVDRLAHDEHGFRPLQGDALRVTIPKGGNLGLDASFSFKGKIGEEPEDIFFRYYLRFASDWSPTLEGGKLPGVAGTYGQAGWGGRKGDATEGWSMRGLFHGAMSPGNPLRDRVPIGTYAYHADGGNFWGDPWDWVIDARGLLERGRWYCLEQYFKVNTPRMNDGVMRAWVDGQLAFEKTDIRVRDIPSIKVERIWMNVYHGGQAKAPSDLRLYIDNVVIARKAIGCMNE